MSGNDDFGVAGPDEGIAVVGMAGRFPGAADVAEFWRNLCRGRDCVTDFSEEELAEEVPPDLLRHPDYVRSGAVLEGVDLFDAGFFGCTPREAQVMDPQQRLFLEQAWHALEDAGWDTAHLGGQVGVFAGAALSTYLLNNLLPDRALTASVGAVQLALANDKDSLSTRTSYLLGLTGPAYSVQSYCSTSLVAVCAACTSLAAGECDAALAGGVAVSVPQRVGYLYQEGGMASPDGRCRAFDAAALGTPTGSGVGVVVLKRLDDALRDGDHVHAVIRGWAVNNDGSVKAGFTAPAVRGQAAVIAEAIAGAGLSPDDIDYVEAHGTGTALGDAAELAALRQAFGPGPAGSCALGSVKTNVGHLDRAAGVAGLIKAVLSVRHGVIPPSLGFERPNPELDRGGRFFVNTALRDWPETGRPRRAGVSAFGIGGTNAHVVLEEPPRVPAGRAARGHQVLVLSARTPAAADERVEALADALATAEAGLDSGPAGAAGGSGDEAGVPAGAALAPASAPVADGVDLADVAFTLQVGRREFEHRRAVVVPDVGEAVAALREGRVLVGADVVGDRPVAFVFAGVGEHYRGMAAGLHEREPAFRQAFDECRAVLDPALGVDLADVVFGGGRAEGGDAFQALLGRTGTDEGELARTALAQPAVFAVEYALARLLMSWGVRPDAFLGYSVGEYVAACLSGVLALPDAARLVAERARLIEGVAPGGMLAVSLPADEAAALVGRGLDVAAVNGPGMSVLAGPVEEVGLAAALLESRGVACRRLTTSHAFHSRALAEVAEPLTRWVAANVEAGAPRIPYLSNVTGTWITAEDVADPAYWARHMCHPVRFGDGAAALLAEPDRVLVEIGVGQSLGALLRGHPDCPAERFGSVVSTLPGRWDRTDDGAAVLTALARMWLAGVAVDWAALHDGEDRRRVPLPTYPFQRESHWVDPPRHRESAATDDRPTAPARRSVREWLHVPVWRARELPAGGAVAGPCLVLADECGVADALAARLAGDGVEVTLVRRGDAFEAVPGDGYRIRPGEAEDHRRLLAALGTPPATVVHLWGVGEAGSEEELRAGREPGFRSLCLLARALAENPAGQVRIAVVTDRVQAVGPDDRPEAGKAAVLGACLVLPQEYPMLRCRAVDVVPGDDRVADLLAEELRWTGTDNQVALRAGERLVWDAAPLSAPGEPADPVLRRGGVYLVTGGLGGVGLELADHLAATCAAKLVLTSRTGLPPRDTWDRHLTDEPDSATSGRIARVREVERRGGEVLVLAADVTDEARMREVVAATRDRFGGLDGVVHAAGVTDVAGFRPVSDLTDEQCAAHFGAKAGGALVLERVLRDEPVGFCVLMSSISAVLGGLGFAAYAAANLVLDALALAHRGPGRWLAVDWDTWESAAAKVRGGRLGAAMTENSLSAAEGVEAFRLALAAPGGRVVVSTGDLARRVERWVGLVGATASPTRAARPALARAYAPADGDHERRMAGLWRDLLGIDRIGVDDNFFDLGGHSLMGLQLINLVNAEFGTALTAVALFESPTVRALTARVAPEAPRAEPGEPEVLAERRHRVRASGESEPVAIIGMAGRFPGAPTVDAFWRNLLSGTESITRFSPDELLAAGVPEDLVRDPAYVPARPVLDDVRSFDARFFGYSPREAELADPQHRLFLECCWEALEVAGYASARYDGLVGVFGGASISTYWHRISSDRELFGSINEYQAIIGGDKDALTTMVSYKLGLRGPSIAVQTFCSTSLVAVHLACQSLRTGESDVALAGGVTVRVPDRVGHLYQEGGMGSPDGHVRSFDARAAGSMFGDGSAVVALKRLSDAVADGDDVVAVIRGSAVNNDGSVKVGFTAPSVGGQVAVIRRALADAGLSPEDIGCVEAHGTATELGDPIEVAALNAVFGPGRPGTCALGSAKTNVGHLDHAAGVAGLIKAALSVRHGVIPPSLHFERPNPEIDFSAGPFYVNTELRAWPDRDGPRRAGLNSLGLGGTNAHVVVEEPPPPPPADPPGRPHQLLVFSGRADAAVDELVASVADVLADDGVALADAAYTLQVGRREFEHRRAVVAADTAEAVAALRAGEVLSTADVEFEVDRPVAFVFADAAADAEDLYEREPVFRAAVDECRALPDRGPAAEAFTTGYALGRLLTSWGLRPDALAGHGAGECVAACLSGALTLPEALRLAVERARLAPSELAEWARANLDPAVPTIPYVSGTTGEWASASPEDWGREPGAEPVDLVDAVTRGSSRIAVRVGAGRLAGAVPTLAEDGGDRQRSVLTAVARLWLAGVPVDWAGLHAGERRRRVPLPTYPFQRRLYWLAPTEPAARGGAGKALSALGREDPDRWLYLPAWRQTAPPAPAAGGGAPWLALVGGPAGEAVADAVAEEVGRSGGEVIRVRPGDGFAVLDDGSHTARPDSRADLKAVLARLWEADRRPRRLLHLLTLDTDPEAPAEEVLDRGFHSVVALAQALQDLGTGEVRVDVVTRGTQRVLGDEPLLPEQAAVVGPCRVVPLESPTTACRLIDVVLPDDRTPPAGLLAELAAEPEDRAVALRAGRRWVPAYEPVPAPPAPPSPVRDGGVYVVTGGLGGIGLAMAERLARAARARIVLLGRTGLPRRADWPALLADDQLDADVRRRVEGVRRIEATGAEVLVLAADVGDEEEVRAALATARERFGPVTGVLHAAGVPGLGLLPFKQREAADRVLRPKVAGTRALERALRDDPVEFVVLFSSITSLTGGGPGQVDYCAANAFLDAWAHRAADDGRRVVAVDWGEWRWNAWDVGLAGYDARVREFFRATRERFGIDFDEGWAALTAALATGLPQVVVSTQDFRAVADLGGLFTTEAVRRQGPAERHPRPDLTTTFVAPGTPVERTVADIWADALGVAEIGVRDNFFELGGNSLVGVDVVTRVRAAFPGADLAPHALYEAPTVRALARLVGGEGDARDGREQDDRQARGARRRQALGQVRSRT